MHNLPYLVTTVDKHQTVFNLTVKVCAMHYHVCWLRGVCSASSCCYSWVQTSRSHRVFLPVYRTVQSRCICHGGDRTLLNSMFQDVGLCNAGAWLQRWLGQCGRALLDKAGVAEVALDSVTVTDGQVNMWIAGESVPRQFEQADYTLSFGRDYQDLDLTLSGLSCHLVNDSCAHM